MRCRLADVASAMQSPPLSSCLINATLPAIGSRSAQACRKTAAFFLPILLDLEIRKLPKKVNRDISQSAAFQDAVEIGLGDLFANTSKECPPSPFVQRMTIDNDFVQIESNSTKRRISQSRIRQSPGARLQSGPGLLRLAVILKGPNIDQVILYRKRQHSTSKFW